MRTQKQLFGNICKLFPYVLYNITYLLVISHLGGYPLSLVVTYSMSSAYYTLALSDRPNLLSYQILFFHLYLRKYVNNLVGYSSSKKYVCKIYGLIFDLEGHGQTSV